MKITNIRVEEKEGRRLLRCSIDDREALVTAEHKPHLVKNGIVYLIGEPEAPFDEYTVKLDGRTLKNCTDDKEFFSKVFLPFYNDEPIKVDSLDT